MDSEEHTCTIEGTLMLTGVQICTRAVVFCEFMSTEARRMTNEIIEVSTAYGINRGSPIIIPGNKTEAPLRLWKCHLVCVGLLGYAFTAGLAMLPTTLESALRWFLRDPRQTLRVFV